LLLLIKLHNYSQVCFNGNTSLIIHKLIRWMLNHCSLSQVYPLRIVFEDYVYDILDAIDNTVEHAVKLSTI